MIYVLKKAEKITTALAALPPNFCETSAAGGSAPRLEVVTLITCYSYFLVEFLLRRPSYSSLCGESSIFSKFW